MRSVLWAVIAPLAVLACTSASPFESGMFASSPPLPVTGGCTASATVLARIPHVQARPMAMDEANVYVVAAATDGGAKQSLWRVPKAGGVPELIADGQDAIGGVDVGDALFWTTGGDAADASGAVWKVSPSAKRPAALVTGRMGPGALIVVGGRVYWAEHGVDASGQPFGAVMWTSTAGGDVAMLQRTAASQIPRTFDALDNILFWTTSDPLLGNESNAEVMSAPLPLPFGATTRMTGPEAGGAGAIEAIRAQRGPLVVYSQPAGIAVVTPTNAPRHVIPTGGFVSTIEEDGANVYFVDPKTAKLMVSAVESDAGPPRAIAEGVDPESAFQVDDACVYLIDARAGAVTMVHK